MNGRLGWMLGLAAVTFLAAGCPSTSTDTGGASSSGSPELTPLASPYIPEVPVPLGFKYKEEKSHTADWKTGRYIDHLYSGSGDKYAVARFYRKRMPDSGWVQKPEEQGQGVVNLAYDREGESCRITISGGGFLSDTEIHVIITPNPQAKGLPPPPRNK